MTEQALAERPILDAKVVESVLLGGDLSKLSPEQRTNYYLKVCDSLGLNPLTKPFAYLTLNGKTVLYALKDCTEQLRNIHHISITIAAREVVEGCYVVTSRAKNRHGREDESIGAVPIDNLKGEARSNAMMKSETKSKRRVTLSICGLGMLDETEIDSIPGAQVGDPLPPVVIDATPTPEELATVPDGAVLVVHTRGAKTSTGKAYWVLTLKHAGNKDEEVVAWEQQLGALAEQRAQMKTPVYPIFSKGTFDSMRVVKELSLDPPGTKKAAPPSVVVGELTAQDIPF